MPRTIMFQQFQNPDEAREFLDPDLQASLPTSVKSIIEYSFRYKDIMMLTLSWAENPGDKGLPTGTFFIQEDEDAHSK